MNRSDFYNKLSQGDLEVVFTKKTDGSTKVMKCSLSAPGDEHQDSKRTIPDTLITVFDIEAQEYRSFYSDSIKEVKELGTSFSLLQE